MDMDVDVVTGSSAQAWDGSRRCMGVEADSARSRRRSLGSVADSSAGAPGWWWAGWAVLGQLELEELGAGGG
jgi:hypothetical protein